MIFFILGWMFDIYLFFTMFTNIRAMEPFFVVSMIMFTWTVILFKK